MNKAQRKKLLEAKEAIQWLEETRDALNEVGV